MENKIVLRIISKLENLSIVRVTVSSFLVSTNITIDELTDIKTAISEAVTNSIEHGYYMTSGMVDITLKLGVLDDMTFLIAEISDYGCGIENIELACTPAYTSKPELEHAGMGFTIMETFMDEVIIDSNINEGTKITMRKKLRSMRE